MSALRLPLDTSGGEAPGFSTSDHTAPSSEPDPLDRLLAEYDERNGAGNGAAADPAGYTPDELARLLDLDGQEAAREAARLQTSSRPNESVLRPSRRSRQWILPDVSEKMLQLRGTVHALQQTIFAEQQRQARRRSKADFDALVAPVQRDLEADGLDIPPNHVETHLLAAAARDPTLIEAFKSRYFQGHDPLQAAQLEAGIRQQGETWAKAALSIANPAQRLAAQRHIEARMREMCVEIRHGTERRVLLLLVRRN